MARFTASASFLALALAVATPWAEARADVFAQAVQAFQAGDFAAAHKHATEAYKASPSVNKHAALLVWTRMKTGDMAGAEALLRDLQKRAPDYIETIQLGAWMAYIKGDLTTAAKEFKREEAWADNHLRSEWWPYKYGAADVSFIKSIHADANNGLALLALAARNEAEAEKRLKAAADIEEYGGRGDVLLALADLQARKGKLADALETLAPLVGDARHGSNAFVMWAGLAQGKSDDIIRRAQGLARAYPAVAFYPAMIALGHAVAGQAAEADKAMDQAVLVSATPVDATMLKAVAKAQPKAAQWLASYGLRVYDNGLTLASRAFLAAGEDCDSRRLTAWADHYLGYEQAALDQFTALAGTSCGPKAEITLGQGVALLGLGKFDDADKRFVEAVQQDPKYSRAKVARAAVAFFKQDYKSAIRIYEENRAAIPAEKIWSWGSHALNNLGWAYYYTEDYTKADTVFRDLIKAQEPAKYASPLAGLGWANWRLGKSADAKTLFEQSLALAPGYQLAASGLEAVKGPAKK